MRFATFRQKFMDPKPGGWMIEIDDFYLQSSVSYYGLRSYVQHYSQAVQIVKGVKIDPQQYSSEKLESLLNSCCILYGLLHQRFIATEDGVRHLYRKYQDGVYGKCPRAACCGRHLIPTGLSIEIGHSQVLLWCPQCHDLYKPNPEVDIDGAYFGPDLPIMFHKIAQIPLKFKSFLNIYRKTTDDEGKEIPAIKQRLYRWGEKKLEKITE